MTSMMRWNVDFYMTEARQHFTSDETEGIHRLKFEASDIKVIIFPDENTKQQSLRNNPIKAYFSKHLPIMATLDDCRNL